MREVGSTAKRELQIERKFLNFEQNGPWFAVDIFLQRIRSPIEK